MWQTFACILDVFFCAVTAFLIAEKPKEAPTLYKTKMTAMIVYFNLNQLRENSLVYAYTTVTFKFSQTPWHVCISWLFKHVCHFLLFNQASVVQRADNFIHWISRYLAEQMYSNQRFWQVFHAIPYLNLTYASTLFTNFRIIGKILHTFWLPDSNLSSG